jgi:hypothetical protein
MLFTEELLANAAITSAETFILVWTAAFPQYTFTGLLVRAFGINLALQLFWDFIIYPYLVNPLRHLPLVKVRVVCLFLYPASILSYELVSSGGPTWLTECSRALFSTHG